MLHYNYEVREDKAYFESIPDITIPAEMLDLAKHIIRSKMGRFDISKFEDRYEDALVEMIRAKQAGRPVTASKPAAAYERHQSHGCAAQVHRLRDRRI